MTWQGSGGPGGPGETPRDPDDATRTDWDVTPPGAPGSLPPVTPPDPFAPGGPLADDVTFRPAVDPLAGSPAAGDAANLPPAPQAPSGLPGEPVPGAQPPLAPPPAIAPAGQPPTSPWAPPVEGGGSWGTPPVAGPYAVPGAPGLVYAGAIPRAAAYLVDSVLLGILVSIVTAPFAATAITSFDPNQGMVDFTQFTARSGIASVIGALIEGAYFVLLWMSTGRATLGMRLFNLQVGNAADGAKLTTDQAIKRWLAYGSWLGIAAIVPILAPVVGLVTLGWTIVLLVTTASSPTKQGLHDRFVGSAVVRPATAGNGLAITCLLLAFVLPLLLIFLLIPLIFLGSQVSDILSAVGESI